MKKILSLSLLLLIIFSLTSVYAQDLEATENLGKFGLTEESIKIKLTMLESTINLKIAHIETVITKLNENNSTIDTTILTEETTTLEEIMQRVNTAINNSELTREELLEIFYTEKENTKESITKIRTFLETIPEEIRTPLSEQYKIERHQIRDEYREKINSLRIEHNTKVRQNHKNMYNQLKGNFGQNRKQLNQEFKNKTQEFRQQRNIECQLVKTRINQNRQMNPMGLGKGNGNKQNGQ